MEKKPIVQIVLGLIANFSSLAPSMSLGFSAIALPWLLADGNPERLSESQASWFASIASVATPIGCLVAGSISDRYGRRMTLMVINVVCLIGWIMIVIAYYVQSCQYALLMVGRVFTGLSTGLGSMAPTVYMAEVSTPKLRGMFITWTALSFASGVLLVYMFGWIAKANWGTTAMLCAAFPCVGFLATWIFLVESPSWLVTKNRLEEAKRSMCRLFGAKECDEKIHQEVESLMTSTQRLNVNDDNLKFEEFLKPTFFKPFIIISSFFFFQQFSGVFVIVFYAVDIVNEVKVSVDPYLAICLIATMRVIGSVSVSVLSKRFGRRPLSLVSGAGMTITMISLAGYLILTQEKNMQAQPWLPLTLLMGYFFISTLGFLSLPFGMAAEVFPSKLRGIATGATTCLAYTFSFITVKTYPTMIRTMGNYKLFLFYGGTALFGTIFVAIFLPETKGKTLKEIERYFDKRSEGDKPEKV
ncbi:hypothetical protein FQR65_LT14601 [Abscondita terminalis]|nr:hypothetical protein FQR65_LT14601 [Abscondita terminalis]